MLSTKGYAAQSATSPLTPFSFSRRDVGAKDVLIEIDYCGVCHSDLHQVKNEWGFSTYPIVPGHEIVGRVTQVGTSVTKFKVGDRAGVGCFVDSCRTCANCKNGEENYCDVGFVSTYNYASPDGKTVTYGGYSNKIVVDEAYTLKVSPNLEFAGSAPLLCAGITTYSPLKHWGAGKGTKVAVLGLGGLGHMAVKLGAAMGAEITVLSSSPSKEKDAQKLGAHEFFVMKEDAFKKLDRHFDLIINSVSAPHDFNAYVELLKTNGTMVLLGIPPTGTPLSVTPLIMGRRSIAGSVIGGIKETQEMLDFCAMKNITSDVEIIPMKEINTAYERMLRNDVKYRFVIDTGTI